MTDIFSAIIIYNCSYNQAYFVDSIMQLVIVYS